VTVIHDQLMNELAREIAVDMPCVYKERGWKDVTEMYCLQPAANRAVARVAPTWSPVPALDSKAFGDKHGWVGVGNVDAVLGWPDGSRTFLELKCGDDLVRLGRREAGGWHPRRERYLGVHACRRIVSLLDAAETTGRW
jgi:hypothetical protein